MSRMRQQQHSEEVRNRILNIARRIISEEGVEALSIRRVTKEMEYSVAIVYHYFQNKDELLSCVLQEGYQRILTSITPPEPGLPPDEAIRTSFVSFIQSVLQWPEEYKAFMLSSSPQILEVTSVLGEGKCEARPTLMKLATVLEAGIATGMFAPCDTRLTAQALWSAVFGLLFRLIIERDVSKEQRAALIQRQLDILLKGISA